jgi:hypothetical protein
MSDDAITFTMRFWGPSDPATDAEIYRLRDERPITYRLIVAIEKRRVRGEVIEHLDITADDMAALEIELGAPVVNFRGYPLRVVSWCRHG